MNTSTSITSISTSNAGTQAVTEVQKSGAMAFIVIGGLVGAWALGSLFVGMIVSGGPVKLAFNFIQAVMG